MGRYAGFRREWTVAPAAGLLVLLALVPIASSDCVMFDTCNSVKHGTQTLYMPCVRNSSAKPLPDEARERLHNICPHLFKEGEAQPLCCSAAQVDQLIAQMNMPSQILRRCESCLDNFIKLWCDFTCHPHQDRFVDIVKSNKSAKTEEDYVATAHYRLSAHFGNGLHQSCKNVRFSGASVLDVMCGGGSGTCTLEKWLKFMGTQDHTNHKPFNIEFEVHEASPNPAVYVPDTEHTPCNQRARIGKSACACSDCVETCASETTLDLFASYSRTNRCFMLPVDCSVVGAAATFTLIALSVAVAYGIKSWIATTSTYSEANCKTSESAGAQQQTRGQRIQVCLEFYSMLLGEYAARRPLRLFFLGAVVAVVLSAPAILVQFSEQLVDMWSSPNSRARVEKDFFDRNFGPFMRTEQITIFPMHFPADPLAKKQFNSTNGDTFGPAFRRPFFEYAFKLVTGVMELQAEYCLDPSASDPAVLDGCSEMTNVTLDDICLRPLGAGCLVFSPTSYLQNDPKNLDAQGKEVIPGKDPDYWDYYEDDKNKTTITRDVGYLDHMLDCIKNPLNAKTRVGLPCLGDYGGPVRSDLIFGVDKPEHNTSLAEAMMINFLVSNEQKTLKKALVWEKAFIDFLKKSHHESYTISFMSERSIQDEIERETASDVILVCIAYFLMILYAAFSLGQYDVAENNLGSLLVQSRAMLSVAGVVVAFLSVASALGIFAIAGIRPTMILLLIVPFVVLVVALNNIFLIMRTYQRSVISDESLEIRIGAVAYRQVPSMAISTVSTCACFLIGSLSHIPTLSTVSTCCALALALNFFYQMTCFLALFVWDIKRSEAGRPEFTFVKRLATEKRPAKGYTVLVFRKYYVRILLSKCVRPFVMLAFCVWFAGSLVSIRFLRVGMDQRIPLPEDSYVIRQFNSIERYHTVGPPIFFVVRGHVDYADPHVHRAFCTSGGCDPNSVGNMIRAFNKIPGSTIHPSGDVLNWVDDFLDWQDPFGHPPCCRRHPSGEFCSARASNATECKSCGIKRTDFYSRLSYFVSDLPDEKCSKGGAAAHASSISFDSKSAANHVVASHFMTFHTALKTSSDFIKAVSSARELASVIQQKLRDVTKTKVEVFPYSIFYVFFDVYPAIVSDAAMRISASLATIFGISYLFMAADPWLASAVVATVTATTVNLLGAMAVLEVEFNPISVVNVFMSLAVSMEFSVHIVRAFSRSTRGTRIGRIHDALVYTGTSIFSGMCLIMFGGSLVLAFGHAQIFKIYFFRMFFCMIVFGALHGLIFLPVFLSYFGSDREEESVVGSDGGIESDVFMDCVEFLELQKRTKKRSGPMGLVRRAEHYPVSKQSELCRLSEQFDGSLAHSSHHHAFEEEENKGMQS